MACSLVLDSILFSHHNNDLTIIWTALQDFNDEEVNVTLRSGAIEGIICFNLHDVVIDDGTVEGTEEFLVEIMETNPPLNASGRVLVDILDKDGTCVHNLV